jgi:hypothetical protein
MTWGTLRTLRMGLSIVSDAPRPRAGTRHSHRTLGVSATADGRPYIGHERSNRMTVLNTGNSDDPFDAFVEGAVTASATAPVSCEGSSTSWSSPSG